MNKIHGTIIVIQDKDRNLNDFITKGILFNKPINLFDEYLNYYNNCSSNDNIAERYYSNIGILSIILNIDGITLLSNDGQILGYNIFVDNKNVDTTNVSGGARKRAAYSIENSNIEGLVGIYFQSHDGDNYFKELN
jgi:DNA integrity scanning protein DisA with diadenylate cyclase activity